MNFSILLVFFSFFMVGLISARPNPNPNVNTLHRVHRARRGLLRIDLTIEKLSVKLMNDAADELTNSPNVNVDLEAKVKLGNLETNWLQLEGTLPIPMTKTKPMPIGMGMAVRLHSDVRIECDVAGSPAPVVTWLKNGVPIQSEHQDELESSNHVVQEGEAVNAGNSQQKTGFIMSKVKARLSLPCLRPEDEAEYTCVAQNSKGKVMATTKIVIQENDSSAELRPSCEHKLPMLFSKSGTPAYISSVETLHMEFLGSRAVLLPCQVVGNPKPTIQWTDNSGQMVDVSSGKFKVDSNGSLLIKDLKWSDMGLFSCKAQNSFGHDSASTFVYPLTTEINK